MCTRMYVCMYVCMYVYVHAWHAGMYVHALNKCSMYVRGNAEWLSVYAVCV